MVPAMMNATMVIAHMMEEIVVNLTRTKLIALNVSVKLIPFVHQFV